MEQFQRRREGSAPGSWRRGSAKRTERRRQPRLEGLESRRLLTTLNDSYTLSFDGEPQGITAGPNGQLWFADSGSGVPGQTNYVQSITTGGTLGTPIAVGIGSVPEGIVYVPGGDIWFTEAGANAIGRVNPTTGQYLGAFNTPTANSGPTGITYDPANGLIYFTEGLAGRIGYFNPATIASSADINDSHAVPTFGVSGLPIPNGITYNPADGNLWFVNQGTGQINMFDPATQSFNATAYNMPGGANVRPTAITVGSDGNLWFNEYGTGQVDMFNPTSRTFAANGPYGLPARANNPNAPVVGITAGPDGNIYFTAGGVGQIWWFDPSAITTAADPGTVMHFANTPTANSGPFGIATGPDGNVWFTETSGAGFNGAIGVAQITATTVTAQPPVSVAVGNPFSLTAKITYGNGAVNALYTGPVTVSLAGGPGGTLGGTATVNAVAGVATFDDLTLSSVGNGYTLKVTANGATSAPTNSVNVLPLTAVPTITWGNPADIVYGTALSGTQLDATASVPGTFAYSPAPGALLGAGTHTLSLTFTPNDRADFTATTATRTIVVSQAVPTITWGNPASIVSGTALGPAQLDATASVPGTFTYTPAAGTVLGVGNNQTLSVTFIPADTVDYKSTTATATISVVPTVTAPTIIAERIGAVFLKHNKKGKGIGQPVEQIVLTFSTAMDPGTIRDAGNYQVAWFSTRRIKRKLQTIPHPVAVLSATPDTAGTTVTIVTSAKRNKFAKGGQLTIGSPGSLRSAAEAPLAPPTVFVIAPRAGGIAAKGS